MTTESTSDDSREIAQFTASACQLHATAWVMQLVFADVLAGKSGDKPKEIPRIAVGMPWPLAKVVHRILGKAIEVYEQREGVINVPKTIDEQLDKMLAATGAQQKA